jgi:hypothetical protein
VKRIRSHRYRFLRHLHRRAIGPGRNPQVERETSRRVDRHRDLHLPSEGIRPTTVTVTGTPLTSVVTTHGAYETAARPSVSPVRSHWWATNLGHP